MTTRMRNIARRTFSQRPRLTSEQRRAPQSLLLAHKGGAACASGRASVVTNSVTSLSTGLNDEHPSGYEIFWVGEKLQRFCKDFAT